ncbi:hypothetical protein NQZ68_001486 [Dissostichus eleginoides]|nr:hypothetical protein NQZ68_001486 [Dissostichus eleginoides]
MLKQVPACVSPPPRILSTSLALLFSPPLAVRQTHGGIHLEDYSCSSTKSNTSGRVQRKRAATPAAAEQVYHCLAALSWLVGPSHLECADETIRCNRRVAACCREE